MAELKEGTKETAKQAASRSAKGEDVRDLFETAHLEFLRALEGAPEGANQRFEETYRNYCQEVQDLYTSEEGQKRLVAEGPGAGLASYRNFLQAVQDVYQDNYKQIREAHLNYLRAVQKAWSRLDVESADPILLAGISQSLLMVAMLAGPSTVGNG